jgi:hypothetical protein
VKNSVKLLSSDAAVAVLTILGACTEETVATGTDERASAYFDDGCAAGRSDRLAGLSMAYERNAGAFDSESAGSFQAGYEKCWMQAM